MFWRLKRSLVSHFHLVLPQKTVLQSIPPGDCMIALSEDFPYSSRFSKKRWLVLSSILRARLASLPASRHPSPLIVASNPGFSRCGRARLLPRRASTACPGESSDLRPLPPLRPAPFPGGSSFFCSLLRQASSRKSVPTDEIVPPSFPVDGQVPPLIIHRYCQEASSPEDEILPSLPGLMR